MTFELPVSALLYPFPSSAQLNFWGGEKKKEVQQLPCLFVLSAEGKLGLSENSLSLLGAELNF